MIAKWSSAASSRHRRTAKVYVSNALESGRSAAFSGALSEDFGSRARAVARARNPSEISVGIQRSIRHNRLTDYESAHAGDHGVGKLVAHLVLTVRLSDEVDAGQTLGLELG